jgi:hypothetical protein
MMTLINNSAASPKVHAIYDGTCKTRGIDWINNFWQAPPTTRRALDATHAAIVKPGTPIVCVDELGERFAAAVSTVELHLRRARHRT